MANQTRYGRIVERIFLSRYQEGAEEILFEREDLRRAAEQLGINVPKNLGDVLYSFRYRASLPESVKARAPAGKEWIIQSVGRSQHRFVAVSAQAIAPRALLAETKVPDST